MVEGHVSSTSRQCLWKPLSCSWNLSESPVIFLHDIAILRLAKCTTASLPPPFPNTHPIIGLSFSWWNLGILLFGIRCLINKACDILQELVDVPLFVSLHNLCATLKCTSPSAVMFRSAVINAGYRISGSHVSPLGMKTDAPMDVIWDIMRCWVRSHFPSFHSWNKVTLQTENVGKSFCDPKHLYN